MADCKRTFTHLSRAYYGNSILKTARHIDEVNIHTESPEGGIYATLSIRWYDLHTATPAPRLEVFDDSWAYLPKFLDLLQELAKLDNRNATPEQICAVLTACGFEDMTKEAPDALEA